MAWALILYFSGGITSVDMANKSSCEQALFEIKQEVPHIVGICVEKWR